MYKGINFLSLFISPFYNTNIYLKSTRPLVLLYGFFLGYYNTRPSDTNIESSDLITSYKNLVRRGRKL